MDEQKLVPQSLEAYLAVNGKLPVETLLAINNLKLDMVAEKQNEMNSHLKELNGHVSLNAQNIVRLDMKLEDTSKEIDSIVVEEKERAKSKSFLESKLFMVALFLLITIAAASAGIDITGILNGG